MPQVIFEDDHGSRVSIEVGKDGALVDVCDEHLTPVPFSCRSASCGTCRVRVEQGADLLDAPRAEELEVLAAFGDEPGATRLACQARVRACAGVIRLRVAGD